MPTPAQLRRMAQQAERDRETWQARADRAANQRDELNRLADEAEGATTTNAVLHNRERSGNVSDVTRRHHALAIAKAAAGDDPFLLHITAKGFSQNKVAKRAGCSAAALSRYRKDRPCPTTIANRIQAATGWPADAGHWPAGLA